MVRGCQCGGVLNLSGNSCTYQLTPGAFRWGVLHPQEQENHQGAESIMDAATRMTGSHNSSVSTATAEPEAIVAGFPPACITQSQTNPVSTNTYNIWSHSGWFPHLPVTLKTQPTQFPQILVTLKAKPTIPVTLGAIVADFCTCP